MRQGEAGHDMFIVHSGRLEVLSESERLGDGGGLTDNTWRSDRQQVLSESEEADFSVDEAEAWEREMAQAMERVNSQHWGVSKSFIREQRDRWAAEGERCRGMTVAEYFEAIGLGQVYEQTWGWCAGVLAELEAKEHKTAADWREIRYYTRKVEKTFRQLRLEGLDEAVLSRAHAPIGLDIMAETPEEIAVAIVGELIRHRRQEGSTKKTRGAAIANRSMRPGE